MVCNKYQQKLQAVGAVGGGGGQGIDSDGYLHMNRYNRALHYSSYNEKAKNTKNNKQKQTRASIVEQ